LKDDSTDAFAKVVDRLLASPRYGERWARHWLDIARYGDDIFLSTEDKAYPNSMAVSQLGDPCLEQGTCRTTRSSKRNLPATRIGEPAGTGFYAMSPEMQDDRVDATTARVLGLTVACAQCHDHKFDPIPQKDFTQLQGVFTNTKLG
jgi:hypothetical protein